MTYSVSGVYLGERVTVTWDDKSRSLIGDEVVWQAVVERAKRPLDLTPTGPTLDKPDPTLPGHALALLSSLIRVTSILGDPPEPPEGVEPFSTEDGAVY